MDLPIHECFFDLSVVEYLGILWPDRSRRALDAAFARGWIRRRGQPVSPYAILRDAGSLELTVPVDEIETFNAIPLSWAVGAVDPPAPRVLHEDDRIVVLSKPSGLPVVPDRSRSTPSCLEFLARRELEARASKPPERFVRCRVVHRIDRMTSGLVIFARTLEAERRLNDDFEARRIRKEYRALVEGVVAPARITIDCPIGTGRKGKMRAVARGGKSALTTFEVLERFDDVTLVRARPITGRTHQIRVHAWAIGHPLAVDRLYRAGEFARRPSRVSMERLTLHARRYELPETWEAPRIFTCEPPEDFERALRQLRHSRGASPASPSE